MVKRIFTLQEAEAIVDYRHHVAGQLLKRSLFLVLKVYIRI